MKLRYIGLSLVLAGLSTGAFAQQKLSDGSNSEGIGIHADAILELSSRNKGLLHTRVALESTTLATPLSKHVAGMMVYNILRANDVVPGIYYNDGTKWVLASAGSATNIFYNPTDYIITYVDADGKEVNIDFKKVVKDNETVTTLTKNVNGTYTYTSENGTVTVIDVPADVINNFEQIVQNGDVLNHLVEVLGDTYVGGNVYYDGDKFTYVTVEGERKEITIRDIVEANETETTLIKNNDGTYTYTNEKNKVTIIDIPAEVINNFEQIVKEEVTVDGRTFETVEQYITYLTESKGGFTKIVYDETTGDVIFQEWNEVTNTWVNVDNSKFETIVKGNETVTDIVDNGNGTFTYTNEKGEAVTFDATRANIKDNGNGTYTIVDVNGALVTIDVVGDVVNNLKNEGDIYNEIINILQQKTDVLVDNEDGTYTHTSVDGKAVIIDANTTTVEEADGVYTFKNGKGETITRIDTNAEAIAFDNTDNDFNSTNVQDALEELKTTINTNKGDLTVSEGIELHNSNGTDKLLADAHIRIANGGITTAKLADNAVTSEKIKDGEVKTADIANKTVTADKLTAGTGNANRIAIADAAGNVAYSDAIPSTSIIGQNVTAASDKVILGGTPTGAALKAFSVDVDETKLNLNADQIKGGNEGDLIVADADGKGQWISKSEATTVSNTSSGNALTTTVNGTTGVAVNIINSNALTLSDDNELVSTVNGIASTSLNLKTAIQQEQKTVALVNGTNTTVQSEADATDVNQTNWQVNVATAKGATGSDAATLGLVKEASANPTVLVSQTGELSVNMENLNAIKEITADYPAMLTDGILLGNASSGDITITLPTAQGNKGKKLTIKKEDANEDNYVNVIGTIIGVPTGELYTAVPYTGWELVSDGTAWRITNKF